MTPRASRTTPVRFDPDMNKGQEHEVPRQIGDKGGQWEGLYVAFVFNRKTSNKIKLNKWVDRTRVK